MRISDWSSDVCSSDLARIVARGLRRDFGIDTPRIALAGLNPHAGENGQLGDEEERVMKPAVAQLAEDGIVVDGPAAADALFAPGIRDRYDALLCGYHAQVLAPFKALHFHDALHLTPGLPIIHSTPAHRTPLAPPG